MRILSIETSCDETAIAIAEFSRDGADIDCAVLAHLVSSQVAIHREFGGVVPNLAKREHQRNLVPMLETALADAGILERIDGASDATFRAAYAELFAHEPDLFALAVASLPSIKTPAIDAIAVTFGPGLAPALWVGVNFARALARLWDKPIIPVNHMNGHLASALLAPVLGEEKIYRIPEIAFPLLTLLVSGGHTELVLADAIGSYRVIGSTLDDAAGEAFDKVARMLDLPYPGGPAIAEAAKEAGNRPAPIPIKLPRPMQKTKDYDFSFSGLKTAVRYLLRDRASAYPIATLRPFVAREFQNAVVEVLVKKTMRAASEFGARSIALGGGVAANAALRASLTDAAKLLNPNPQFLAPVLSLTGDNALMIATAAFLSPNERDWKDVAVDAHSRIGKIMQ